jgi:hypothetical protein
MIGNGTEVIGIKLCPVRERADKYKEKQYVHKS